MRRQSRRMRSKGTILIIISAAGLGAFMAALAPTFLPGTHSIHAWLFGVGLGLIQSLFRLHLCRRAIARADDSVLLSLGSGAFRLMFLIFALAVAIRLGMPAAATTGSLLSMYLFMMLAEVLVVVRETNILHRRGT